MDVCSRVLLCDCILSGRLMHLGTTAPGSYYIPMHIIFFFFLCFKLAFHYTSAELFFLIGTAILLRDKKKKNNIKKTNHDVIKSTL